MRTSLFASLALVATTSEALAHPGHEAAGDSVHVALAAGAAIVVSLAYFAARSWNARRSSSQDQ